MRISISNIAWEVEDDERIVQLLHKYGVDAIDVAPSKYFSDCKTVSDAQVIELAGLGGQIEELKL